jgi:flagellar hook protein FlgE
MINNALLQIGATGIQTGFRQAEQAATDIASAVNNDDAALTHSVVDLLQAENQVKASAQVVKTADQLIGSLIDTMV